MNIFSALVKRLSLARSVGYQYSNARDVYQALGYPDSISSSDYIGRFMRQDIAMAVITRPVNATWKGDVLVQSEDDKFNNVWDELYSSLKLESVFKRLDILTCLGQYGVLLLGFSDVDSTSAFSAPVSGSPDLLYVKPYSQASATVKTTNRNTTDSRYGLPELYEIQTEDRTIVVHYSRVIHVLPEVTLESEYLGLPVLEKVYNRLLDLEKLVGGSAEMFWRGARPGYQGKLDPDYQMTDDLEDKLKDQIDEYEHNLRRILISQGIDLEALASQVYDPKSHVDIQISMISAVTGIPKRILTGSERGELSSSQDVEAWKELIDNRRKEYAENNILLPFIDMCVESNILPDVDYWIEWPDLYSQSDKEKAEIGKVRAQALKDYSTDVVAQSIIPPEVFLSMFLGLSDEQASEIIDKMKEYSMSQIKEDEE